MPHLTKRFIEQLPPGETFVWDDELPSFGVRVRVSGRKVYVVQTRDPAGHTRRVTLGRCDLQPPEQARKEARALLWQIHKGDQVLRSRHCAVLFAEVAEQYLQEYAIPRKKASSVAGDRHLLRKHLLPAFGDTPIAALERRHLAHMHDALKRTPYVANRALALTSCIFTFADRAGLVPPGTNPVRGIERYRERPRSRFLDAAEIERLHAALAEAEGRELPSALLAIRLLIVTGARKSEILRLQWQDIDLEREVADLRDSKTGAKTLYLGPVGVALLRGSPREVDNPYVIGGRKAGGHLVGLPRVWERIRKAARLDGVRLHDLRHSHASAAVALGMSLPVIGHLLGHKDVKTTQRYSHVADGPARDALELIQQQLTRGAKAHEGSESA